MDKKVVIISSSMRKHGNSHTLAKEFERGATDAGNTVEFIDLADIDLHFCRGCMQCQSHGTCVINDGMQDLYEKVQHADVLVFATPIYYYEMSGQLKTFIDRLNPLYPKDNAFRKVYLIATCADEDKAALDNAIKGINGWTDCFVDVDLDGVVYGTGVTEIGEIITSPAMHSAYDMGNSI